ncbi:MAG TPA: hypothetical protein VJX66_10990 [Amycolatopsis sp.]|nr:hypothetical protein [Amycolatopsis sp.]
MRESETRTSEHLSTADLAAAAEGADTREGRDVPEAREAPETRAADDREGQENLEAGLAPPEHPRGEELEFDEDGREEPERLEGGLAPPEHPADFGTGEEGREEETNLSAGLTPPSERETSHHPGAQAPETDAASEETRSGRQAGLDESAPPLFTGDQTGEFRERWHAVQSGFVDDPHQAVRDADELVASVISTLANTFAEHRGELETQWQQGEPATEDLRVVFRRYRAFFDQLLGG